MRILQGAVKTRWIGTSSDPGRTIIAYVVGSGQMTILLDDQGISTKTKGLEVVAPDSDTGIIFAAKDYETLIRGFKYFGDSGKAKGKREFYMKERSNQGLAAMFIWWQDAPSRHSNKASAAIFTAGFNVKQFLSRAIIKTSGTVLPSTKNYWQNAGVLDDYQSVSDNMDSAGRDGKMLSRGAAVYVCPSSQMPLDPKWGKTYRQIGETLTLGTLATIVTKLSWE